MPCTGRTPVSWSIIHVEKAPRSGPSSPAIAHLENPREPRLTHQTPTPTAPYHHNVPPCHVPPDPGLAPIRTHPLPTYNESQTGQLSVMSVTIIMAIISLVLGVCPSLYIPKFFLFKILAQCAKSHTGRPPLLQEPVGATACLREGGRRELPSLLPAGVRRGRGRN